MGNCFSAKAAIESEAPQSQVNPNFQANAARGVSNKLVLPLQSAGSDLQVAVCSAAWAANAAERTPSVVKLTPQHCFLALFEGLGERGDVIAAFCRTAVYEVFLECSLQSQGDTSAALKATFARLDERVLASDRIPNKVKANSGTSGVIGYIDLASRQCTVANVGNAQALLGRIVGSFNAKQAEGFFLSADHTLRNTKERVRLHKRSLSEPQEAASAMQVVGGVEMVQGSTQLTRAIGFGAGKQHKGKASSISCQAEVTDHRLTATDQLLIIGSSGLWDVMGPQEAALRSHFYEKFVQAQELRARTAAAPAGEDGNPAPSPVIHQPNTAEHLVLHTMSKVADRLTRHTCQAEPLSVADMMQIPFERPLLGARQQPSQPAGEGLVVQGSGNEQEEEEEVDVPFIRRELHGDMAAVVVSLRWQNLSMDSQMRDLLVAVQRAPWEDDYMKRLVRARWAQIRMLVEFRRAYRRTLLRKWWEAADQTYKHGMIKARHLQEMIFNEQGLAVKVSPSIKIRDAAKGTPIKLEELRAKSRASASPIAASKAC